jgi:hypothetical protein
MLSTPVLFLIFNRPDLTQQVFKAIREAKPKYLYVAADGPRENTEGEVEKCKLARQIINQVDWACEIQTLFRDRNLGCKEAVSSAINWFFEHVEEGIILEDDTLPNQGFFAFCTVMLQHYRQDHRIMHIGGNNFQSGIKRGKASYYFSYLNHIWGWATWRRAWKLYDVDMQEFKTFENTRAIQEIFQKEPIQQFWMNTFYSVYTGSVDTWDAQWSFACIKNRGLSILPQVNLVTNIGFREDATHTLSENSPLARIPTNELNVIVHPKHVEIDEAADMYTYKKYFGVNFFNLYDKQDLTQKGRYGFLLFFKKALKKYKDLLLA